LTYPFTRAAHSSVNFQTQGLEHKSLKYKTRRARILDDEKAGCAQRAQIHERYFSKMTTRVRVLLLAVAIACVGGYLLHARALPAKPQDQAKAEQRIPVSLVTAQSSSYPVLLKGLGVVVPFNNVVVRSRVDGEIIKIAFQEGQTVRQGELLAQIDSRPYQAALDQAIAKKTQDDATLKNAKLDLDR
jgi:multidrug efflux system membrane fusion protein